MANFQNRKTTEINEHHRILAYKLHEHVVEVLKIRKPWSKSKWANEFRILEDQLNGDRERITTVLHWLLTTKLSWVQSAESFRKKFLQLEEKAAGDYTTVAVTEWAEGVAEMLKTFYFWPKNSGKQLPAAVQVSIDNLKPFSIFTRTREPDSFGQLVAANMPAWTDFIERWFESVNKRVYKWEDWDGNLMRYVFTVDSERFQQMGQQWAAEYGDSSLWPKLMKEYKDET
jgi:hypothetical protein